MRKKAAPDDFDLNFEIDTPEPRNALAARLLGSNPAARIGSAGLAALAVAIAINVVFLQDQRHAAPLFQTSLRSQATAALAEPVAQAPLPAPRPVELAPVAKPAVAARPDPIGREIARLDQSPARAEKAPPVEQKASDAKQGDAIGGLIRNVAAPQASEPDASVLAAQRALMKLGFVLRPDGVFGGTTRQAIERFERDNRMPVRGELTSRVKTELARQSGVEID